MSNDCIGLSSRRNLRYVFMRLDMDNVKWLVLLRDTHQHLLLVWYILPSTPPRPLVFVIDFDSKSKNSREDWFHVIFDYYIHIYIWTTARRFLFFINEPNLNIFKLEHKKNIWTSWWMVVAFELLHRRWRILIDG